MSWHYCSIERVISVRLRKRHVALLCHSLSGTRQVGSRQVTCYMPVSCPRRRPRQPKIVCMFLALRGMVCYHWYGTKTRKISSHTRKCACYVGSNYTLRVGWLVGWFVQKNMHSAIYQKERETALVYNISLNRPTDLFLPFSGSDQSPRKKKTPIPFLSRPFIMRRDERRLAEIAMKKKKEKIESSTVQCKD
jgi:hypothetical protein